jgi:hypothetical protein
MVVRSKPWFPNCDRAVARIVDRVASPSRALVGMPISVFNNC